MEIWSYDGKLYEIISMYSLPDDAWHYELTGLTGPPGTGPYLAIDIPDTTPDGALTLRPAQHVKVHAGGGVVPWLILKQLIDQVDSSGDLVDEERDSSAEATVLPLTLNAWSHGNQRFEVNHFHNDDAWNYELYEVDPDATENNYLDVRIPDASPNSGPFIPMPGDYVTLTMHGRWTLPWPVFRRFLDAIQAAGDIVPPTGDKPIPADRP